MPPGIVDDIIRKLETHVSESVNVLNAILQMPNIKPKIPLFDTFQMLTEDSTEIKQNWENMCVVNIDEFKCQVNNLIATNIVFTELIKHLNLLFRYIMIWQCFIY